MCYPVQFERKEYIKYRFGGKKWQNYHFFDDMTIHEATKKKNWLFMRMCKKVFKLNNEKFSFLIYHLPRIQRK